MPPVASDREVQRAREAVRAWRESIHPTVQQAPEGLLPPRTAPDTPNVTRQYIENSDKLSDQAKKIALNRDISTNYMLDNGGSGGHYTGGQFGGRLVSNYDSPVISEHEAVHAANARYQQDDLWNRPANTMARESDVKRLAAEGYPWAQNVVDTIDNSALYGNNNRLSNAKEYLAYAAEQNPAEVPPWFRQRHLSPYWSQSAMNAEAPPLPDNRVAGMAPSPQAVPPSYGDMLTGPDGASLYQHLRDQINWAEQRSQQRGAYAQELWSQYQQDNPNWGPKTRDEYFREQRNNDVRYKGLIFGYG